MGAQYSEQQSGRNLRTLQNYKLHSILPINSVNEQQQMVQYLQKRIKLAQCPYICTVRSYNFIDQQITKFSCSQDKKLVVYYQYFDYRLTDVSIKSYKIMFNQFELCYIIKCISEALLFLRFHKLHHGDVSLQNICRKGKIWKLIDKVFLKNGINAYEKVLEGQKSFISPKQMTRIRYGFIRQSPQLAEADDIFGLGMVILQLASGVPSSLCYKQQNIRFNQQIFFKNLSQCKLLYSSQFNQLLERMLHGQQTQRITLNQILNNQLIAQIQGVPTFLLPTNIPKVAQNPLVLQTQRPGNLNLQSFSRNLNTNLINTSSRTKIERQKIMSCDKRKPQTPTSLAVTQQNSRQTSRMMINPQQMPPVNLQYAPPLYNPKINNQSHAAINNSYSNINLRGNDKNIYDYRNQQALGQNFRQAYPKVLTMNNNGYPTQDAQNGRSNSRTPQRLKTIN